MSEIRLNALYWLITNIPDTRLGITSLMPEFEPLTGLTHKFLMDNWQSWADRGKPKPVDITTCCNAFAIRYCQAINLPDKLVSFSSSVIKNYLTKQDKLHAWVDSGDGLEPDTGDICIWAKSQHVGICAKALLYEDSTYTDGDWYTVEGGQNHAVWITRDKDGNTKDQKGKNICIIDRRNSFDRIRRKKYPDPTLDPPTKKFYPGLLQGWIDIDKYAYGPTGNQEAKAKAVAANRQWFNRDGEVVHPDAPAGSGGQGYFCATGILSEDPINRELPHAQSPAGLLVDPIKILQFKKDYDMS